MPQGIFHAGFKLISQPGAGATTPTPEVAPPDAAVPVCNGKYKGGLKPSPDELADILKKHQQWTNMTAAGAANNDPMRANFCDVDLSGAKLSGADLIFADLSGARLRAADLRAALLSFADH
jgi:pentapeptide repeat protein